MKYLFGTGTARGGTGILVQTLGAHSKIEYSLDPVLEIYRSYRNALVKENLAPSKLAKFDLASPVSDYYFSDLQNEILNLVLNGNLDLKIDANEIEPLIESMKPRAKLDNDDLVEYMSANLNGSNYGELIEAMVRLIARVRGSSATEYCGFHENWTVEMLPSLARKFHHAKFIIVLRDPRAVQSSHLAVKQELRTSLLSFARGIRKLFGLSMQYLNSEIFKERLVVVTYEELLRKPENVSKKLCGFLGLDYEEGMIDPEAHFSPGTTELRNGVSSFEEKATGYKPERIDRWKNHMTRENLEMTEMVLDPDMRFFGYMPTVDRMKRLEPRDAFAALSQDNKHEFLWRTDSNQTELEFGLELSRRNILHNSTGLSDLSLIDRCFLSESIYQMIRDYPEYEAGDTARGGIWFA